MTILSGTVPLLVPDVRAPFNLVADILHLSQQIALSKDEKPNENEKTKLEHTIARLVAFLEKQFKSGYHFSNIEYCTLSFEVSSSFFFCFFFLFFYSFKQETHSILHQLMHWCTFMEATWRDALPRLKQDLIPVLTAFIHQQMLAPTEADLVLLRQQKGEEGIQQKEDGLNGCGGDPDLDLARKDVIRIMHEEKKKTQANFTHWLTLFT